MEKDLEHGGCGAYLSCIIKRKKMTNEINLTDLEKEVLTGINNSDYGDQLGDPIWSYSIDFASSKILSGVVSSLTKKGLVSSQDEGKDSTVWLTDLGIEICKEHGLLGKFGEYK